jgi:hypothetical protein
VKQTGLKAGFLFNHEFMAGTCYNSTCQVGLNFFELSINAADMASAEDKK